MNPKLLIESLMEKHNLSPLDAMTVSGWGPFISSVVEALTTADAERDRLQQLMKLTQDEIESWWTAVDHREAIIKSVLDVSSDGIITLDYYGRIAEFNKVAESIFGVSRADVAQKSILDIINRGPFSAKLRTIFTETGAPIERFERPLLEENPFRSVIFAADGSERITDIYINRVATGAGTIYPLFIRDLSEHFAAQKILEDSRNQATQSAKMASLGEMAGGIAHEINTPLSIFTMYAEVLRGAVAEKRVTDEDVLEAANIIEETAMRISRIIQGLKSFSRDDSGDDFVLSSLSSVVTDTLSLCREKFMGNGTKVIVEAFPAEWAVMGRPTSLCQVLLNLLNNASDAIEELPDRWIRISCTEIGNDSSGSYVLSVTDSGPGIPPEIVQRLMEPFFTTKGIGKGTGLGLSLSKTIVESHFGSITYDTSSANTKFAISLPKTLVNKLVA